MGIKMFDGNGAAVEAIRLARPGVIAAYPITPQSSIAEHLADAVAEASRRNMSVWDPSIRPCLFPSAPSLPVPCGDSHRFRRSGPDA
ncbi:MAG: hypothetical protein ACLUOI_32335 [Eisenbergiella sp.]